jgi:hypothetical protein
MVHWDNIFFYQQLSNEFRREFVNRVNNENL